jgi:hypothetical protein
MRRPPPRDLQPFGYTCNMLIRTAALAFIVLGATIAGSAFPQAPDAPVAPAIPQYKVEVVIFAYRDIDQTEERFSHRPPGAELRGAPVERREPRRFDDSNLESLTSPDTVDRFGDDAAFPPDAAAPALHFRLLRSDELQLTTQYSALERIDAYVPLVHAGWVQQGLAEDQAQPFDLALLGALNPSGTIRLHLSRFLHFKVDLTYQSNAGRAVRADAPFGSRELSELALPPRYTLQAERQTRSGELHYFDHPAFGLLVMVTPLPADAAPVAAGGAEPAA